MATENDSGGLVDRRSIRELEETSVGGKNAPRDARKQLENTKRLRQRMQRMEKRLQRMKDGQSTDSSQ